LVAHGQKWIRIGVASWDVQSGGSGTRINWKAASLRYLDEAIDFVHRSGLKLYLITAEMPSWAESSPLDSYNRSAAAYCAHIAERYKSKISVWQVFNATNQQHYKTHAPVTLSSTYLREESEVLAHLRGAIKSVDPSILITTNSDGFPLSEDTRENYVAFFDGIQSQLDMIALDLYPATDHAVIKKLGQWIDTFRDRYGKPVAVAEIGLQTCAGCWGGDPFTQQEVTLVAAVAELKQADASLVLVYGYRDWGTDPSDGEQNFGIVRFDGTHKPSYDAVMAAMR
jgi:hypothetical protein